MEGCVLFTVGATLLMIYSLLQIVHTPQITATHANNFANGVATRTNTPKARSHAPSQDVLSTHLSLNQFMINRFFYRYDTISKPLLTQADLGLISQIGLD